MIYFARCGSDGPVKIGYTDSGLAARLTFLQVGCPWEITIIGTTDGSVAEESALHQRFAHIHMRGEWFHSTAELLEFIGSVVAPAPIAKPLMSVGDLKAGETDIRAIRTALGMSQTALAEALGVHQATIWQWEQTGVPDRGPVRAALRQFVASVTAAGKPPRVRREPDATKEPWWVSVRQAIDNDSRSPREISLAAGLGVNFVSQMLTTGKAPNARSLVKLANALGISPGLIFERAA